MRQDIRRVPVIRRRIMSPRRKTKIWQFAGENVAERTFSSPRLLNARNTTTKLHSGPLFYQLVLNSFSTSSVIFLRAICTFLTSLFGKFFMMRRTVSTRAEQQHLIGSDGGIDVQWLARDKLIVWRRRQGSRSLHHSENTRPNEAYLFSRLQKTRTELAFYPDLLDHLSTIGRRTIFLIAKIKSRTLPADTSG